MSELKELTTCPRVTHVRDERFRLKKPIRRCKARRKIGRTYICAAWPAIRRQRGVEEKTIELTHYFRCVVR